MNDRYDAYLRSPEWAAQREKALDAAQHCCSRCGAGDEIIEPLRHDDDEYLDPEYAPRAWVRYVILNVHHLTYERLGHEQPGDLVVLCKRCHGEHHAAESLQRLAAAAPPEIGNDLAQILGTWRLSIDARPPP